MLSPKELLQINVTILAGIFILLAIISNDSVDSFEIEKLVLEKEMEKFVLERELLDKQKEDLDIIVEENDRQVIEYTQKLNESKKIFENLNASKSASLLEHDLPYYTKLRDFIKLEYSRIIEKQDLLLPEVKEFNKKMDASNKKQEEILSQIEELEKRAEYVNAELDVNYFKTPKTWIYFMGAFFGTSSLLALAASQVENKRLKAYSDFMKLAYGLMYAGFSTIIIIAITIL